MNQYFINFFTWYYLIKVRGYFNKVKDKFSFSMHKSDTVDMVKFFKTPLYQDNSSFGRFLSLFIRFWWIGFGTLYSVITIIPNLVILLILIILPIVPIVQLLNWLI